jgi:LAO/AO transport system kinase
MEIVSRILAGDRKAVAQLVTLVENNSQEAKKALALLHPHGGKAHIIGVTGPPGCGKSTLISKLTTEYRKKDKKVGIIAIDPTSPFSGGAFLGDRIRMQEHTIDKDVFIRSMGSRGSLGGLARATTDTIKILDAFGKDIIFVETIGVGQADVEIAKTAITLLVVTMPGLGDEIQTLKAGILEIGDIFVVNKADYAGVENIVSYLETMLELTHYKSKDWKPSIIKTIAPKNVGIFELVNSIDNHLAHLRATGELERKLKEKTKLELLELLRASITKYIVETAIAENELEDLVERIVKRELDPYSAVEILLRKLKR